MRTIHHKSITTYERDSGFCRACGVRGHVWVDDYGDGENTYYCLSCGDHTDYLPKEHASRMVDELTDTVTIVREWDEEITDYEWEIREKISDIGRRYARQLFGDGSQPLDLPEDDK